MEKIDKNNKTAKLTILIWVNLLKKFYEVG
jgi:hypothetical protein